MPIETVRISKTGKDQLATLKRRTKIPTWNVLCRWAFCVSMREPTPPHAFREDTEYPIEMTWRTFTGGLEGLYWAVLIERCRKDGIPIDDESLSIQLRLHLHRGISYLAANKKMQGVSDLYALI